MEQIAKDRYQGTLKKGQLSEEHILRTYKELSSGAAKGYGKDFITLVNDQGEPSPEVMQMRQNLYKFSMVKDYAMLEELNGFLSGGKEVMRWEDFKSKALQLNKKYNLNYLQAEWQTALQAGKHAVNWQEFEDNKGLFPNLKYRIQGDDRVRKEHEKLKDIIRPIDDKFWDSNYPPNGWRCRCFVVQTAEDPTTDKNMPDIGPEDVKPEFKINVGKSGEVFKETDANKGKPHPYFALAKTANSETKKAFEYAKLAAKPHAIYKGKNGGSIKLNIFTDRSDLLGNYRSAKAIVDSLGVDIELRPHINIDGIKNPEFLIGKIMGDRVSPKSKNIKSATTNSFKDKLSESKNGQLANEKNCFIVLDIWFEKTNHNIIDFSTQTWSRFNHYKQLDYLIIQDKFKVLKLTRNELNKSFEDYHLKIKSFIKQ